MVLQPDNEDDALILLLEGNPTVLDLTREEFTGLISFSSLIQYKGVKVRCTVP